MLLLVCSLSITSIIIITTISSIVPIRSGDAAALASCRRLKPSTAPTRLGEYLGCVVFVLVSWLSL